MNKLFKVFLFGVSLTLAFWMKHAYLEFDVDGISPEHELLSLNNEFLDVRAFVKSGLGNAYDYVTTIKQTSIPGKVEVFLSGFKYVSYSTDGSDPVEIKDLKDADIQYRDVDVLSRLWASSSGPSKFAVNLTLPALVPTLNGIYQGFMSLDGIAESQFRDVSSYAMSDEASTNLATETAFVWVLLALYQTLATPALAFYLTVSAASLYYMNRKKQAKICLLGAALLSVFPLYFLSTCHSSVQFDIPHYAGLLFEHFTKEEHGVEVKVNEMTALIGYIEKNIVGNLALALVSGSLALAL